MTTNDLLSLSPAQRLVAMLAGGYHVRANEYNDWARDLYQPDGIVYVGSVTATEIELARCIATALAVDAPADVEALAMRAALRGGGQ